MHMPPRMGTHAQGYTCVHKLTHTLPPDRPYKCSFLSCKREGIHQCSLLFAALNPRNAPDAGGGTVKEEGLHGR